MTETSRKMRVLIVDDEAPILSGLRMLLGREKKRWDLSFALGGEKALEELEAAPFDVVVTDMRMPKLDGPRLLEIVQQRWPSTCRIILSGQAEIDAIMHALPAMHLFLSKPCEPETLRQAIDRCTRIATRPDESAMRSLIGRVATLPSPPQLYFAINKLADDPRSSLADVAKLVAGDPSIAAKVLQVANSAAFGSPKVTTSIHQAVQYLGLELLRAIVMTTTLFAPPKGAEPAISLEAVQAASQRTAALARQFVRDKKSGEAAFVAGLLHDIGRIVLAVGLPAEYRAMLDEIRVTNEPVHLAERRVFGSDHGRVGACLLGMWGVPPSICDVVEHHHEPCTAPPDVRELTAAVHAAEALTSDDDATPLDMESLHQLGLDREIARWTELAKAS